MGPDSQQDFENRKPVFIFVTQGGLIAVVHSSHGSARLFRADFRLKPGAIGSGHTFRWQSLLSAKCGLRSR